MRSKSGLAVLGVLVYLLVPYRWALDTRSHDTKAAQQVRGRAALVSARIAHARSVLADPAGWAARVRATEAAFPPTVDVSGELAELRAAAATSGVRIVSITSDALPAMVAGRVGSPTSKEAEPAPPVAESVQLRVQVNGAIPAVEAFLSRLRSAARLFTSTRETIDFGADPRGQSITVDLTAQVWVLPRTATS